jgi:hypothetical protein
LAFELGQQGLTWIRGLVMTTGRDKKSTTAEACDLARAIPETALSAMTPEAARHLAAILAPHLVAMRAVTAGTRYSGGGGMAASDDTQPADPVAGPQISPATTIFIAGMLDRIPA